MHNEARPCSHKMCVRITMEEEKEKKLGLYIYIHDGKEQEEKNEKFHSP